MSCRASSGRSPDRVQPTATERVQIGIGNCSKERRHTQQHIQCWARLGARSRPGEPSKVLSAGSHPTLDTLMFAISSKADICDRLRHDPSPMHEARYRTIRCNPRKPAYCETGRPYLRRTSGLDRGSSATHPRSGGNQPAHQRAYYDSLFHDRASCLDQWRPR